MPVPSIPTSQLELAWSPSPSVACAVKCSSWSGVSCPTLMPNEPSSKLPCAPCRRRVDDADDQAHCGPRSPPSITLKALRLKLLYTQLPQSMRRAGKGAEAIIPQSSCIQGDFSLFGNP